MGENLDENRNVVADKAEAQMDQAKSKVKAQAAHQAHAKTRAQARPEHHVTPPVQRNFLLDYDTMLKVLQLDYVDNERFVASGYSDFMGKLYTMNPGMFQSPMFCDRMLTQMMLHYLTWYQDPGIQIIAGPGANWHVLQSVRTQRYGDALYVTHAEKGAPLQVGDQIIKINGMTLEAIRPEIERTLRTTVEPADPEREDWSVVLDFAKHVTLRTSDEGEREVKLVAGKAAAMTRERKKLGISEPEALGTCEAVLPACELAVEDGVGVLRLRRPGDPVFAELVQRAVGEMAGMSAGTLHGLVIDVRGVAGGSQEDIYPLVSLVLAPGTYATPAELFGAHGIIMNYSRHNVEDKLKELDAIRSKITDAAQLAEVDALAGEFKDRLGKGLVCDNTDYYPDVVFESAWSVTNAASVEDAVNTPRVVVLCDRDTADASEWLVRAAKTAGYAHVMGRATRGSLDNTCPRIVRLDADFSIVVPTAKYVGALGDGATLGRGIVPDEHLTWTPEQLTRDVELEAARNAVVTIDE